jgi:hypothetical protein|tara:strand:+ start:486 stop:614 length:129 start_codon:yes stop_codon:yes gene_type:complete
LVAVVLLTNNLIKELIQPELKEKELVDKLFHNIYLPNKKKPL